MMQRKRRLIMTVAATAQSIMAAAVLFGWHANASAVLGYARSWLQEPILIDTFIWSMTAKAHFAGFFVSREPNPVFARRG